MKPWLLKISGLFVFGLCLSMSGALAHEIRPAYLKISPVVDKADGAAYDLVWKQPVLDAKRLKIEPVLPQTCTRVSGGPGEVTSGAIIERWRVECDSPLDGQHLFISGLERTMVDVFVEIVGADGTSNTRVVKPENPSFLIGTEAGGGGARGTRTYFTFGIGHLFSGLDHIAFIIALVLLVRAPMALFKVVTSFTLAHSLTLALSTFGIVTLRQGVVESVIALSIVLLAVELVRKERAGAGARNGLLLRYPWAITFVFGLLHGFGFAGALADTGLPQGTAALALLLFNLGIEAGQLAIVALVLAALAVLQRLPVVVPGVLARVPAYGIGSFAAYWFIERTLSLF